MHSRDDQPGDCTRGYEYWLMVEAKKRNPKIKIFALSWGVPAWVGNQSYFSQEGVAYQLSWMDCVRKKAGIVVDVLGIWNGECMRLRSQEGADLDPPITTMKTSSHRSCYSQHDNIKERDWGSSATYPYVVNLRKALDNAGFTDTLLAVPDGAPGNSLQALLQDIRTDETLRRAVGVVGVHYPCETEREPNGVQEELASMGKKYWASEE
jgi:hypothetical protein